MKKYFLGGMTIFTQNANITVRKAILLFFRSKLIFFPLNFCIANKQISQTQWCLEQTSHPSPTTTASTTMAEKLFLCFSQHEASFDKRETKKKSQCRLSICLLRRIVSSIVFSDEAFCKSVSYCHTDILKYVQNHPWHSFNLFIRRNPFYPYFMGGGVPETLSIL